MRSLLVLSVLVALLGATVPRASQASVRPEGTPAFGFGASFSEDPALGKVVPLWLTMAGFMDPEALGTATIQLPSGVQLVEGDLVHRGHPTSPEAFWKLMIRPTRIGTFEIHGTLRIESPGGIVDEAVFVTPFSIEEDKGGAGSPRYLRLERVKNGQRYRYGGQYLVPIDASEDIVQDDIVARGQKARLVRSGSGAECRGCLPTDVQRMQYRVLVDPAGKVTDLERIVTKDTRDLSGEVDAAAREAFKSWTFQPSIAKGRPRSDWVEVEIDVRSTH